MAKQLHSAHEKAIAQGKEVYAETKEIQDYALPAGGSLEGHQDPGNRDGRGRHGPGSRSVAAISQERSPIMRGDGRIFQRGSSLWIAYCHRGREVRESVDKPLHAGGIARPATKNDAERLLKLRLKQVGA